MRQAQVGRATAYDILRGNEPRTLQVMLATFGFNIGLFGVVLTGVVWLVFGAALALARPNIKAALYLGLAFIAFGYVLAVLAIRRDVELTAFTLARDAAVVVAVFLGIAVWSHAEYYFPRQHPAPLQRRWALALVYGVALVSAAAVLWSFRNRAFVIGLLATVIVAQLTLVAVRRDRGADERQILRGVRWTTWGLIGIALFAAGVALALRRAGPGLMALLILLVLVPAAHAYTIVKYRLLDLDIRVRRSVQYSLASIAWAGLSMLVLLWLLTRLPQFPLPIPNVHFSGTSIELLDEPLPAEARVPVEKGILMVVAIGLAFLFRYVGRGGQRWIANRFHRTAYDYRRASGALAGVMSSRLDLDGLADGLIDTLVRLMPLKRAGVLFLHGARTYCGARARGFPAEAWGAFCAASSTDVVQGCARATAEVDAEYVFPRLRRALQAAEIQYLYPIRSHERLVGVILVGEKMSEAAFEDDDFQFLGAIAQQVSAGVENAFLYEELSEQERLRHELEIARRIQIDSLPQFTPVVEGLDIAGVSVPAFEVGGDYYDYLNGEPRQLTVMVGDVSGKGTSAALYMSKLQGILRSLHAFNLSPHELFVRTNQLLCRDLERRSFVTAIGGFFHTADRRMVLARAGHLPLYYFDARRRDVSRVLPKGLGFGLSNRHIFDDELEEREIPYGHGDVFLFITDGITECQSADGEDFGEDRVMSLLQDLASNGSPAASIRDRLLQAVRQFGVNVEQFDDQTVVVVRAVS
jgi:serine phosphatase RsbU (regulator of sigma subunit)